MSTTTKTTNRSALTYAIENLTNAPADVIAKLENMIAQLDKKNASPKKLTATQKENEGIKEAIVDFLFDNEGAGYTVSELIKEVPACGGLTTQKVSALVRALTNEGKVTSYSEKRRTYFTIKVEDEEG